MWRITLQLFNLIYKLIYKYVLFLHRVVTCLILPASLSYFLLVFLSRVIFKSNQGLSLSSDCRRCFWRARAQRQFDEMHMKSKVNYETQPVTATAAAAKTTTSSWNNNINIATNWDSHAAIAVPHFICNIAISTNNAGIRENPRLNDRQTSHRSSSPLGCFCSSSALGQSSSFFWINSDSAVGHCCTQKAAAIKYCKSHYKSIKTKNVSTGCKNCFFMVCIESELMKRKPTIVKVFCFN